MSFGFGFGFPRRLTSGGGLSPSLYLDFVGTTTLDPRITFSRGTNATLTNSNGRIAWAPHNLLTNSEDFEAAAWIKTAATVTANVTAAPDATTTGDKLVETAVTSEHYVRTPTVTLPTSGSTAIFSVYAKAGERNWLYLANASYGNFAYFNLATGVVGSTGSATANIVPAGGGWYLCYIAFTANAGGQQFDYRLASANNTTSYAGDGTSGLFLWGAQLNVANAPVNLLTWSQEFNLSVGWYMAGTGVTSALNTEVAPDGTNSADIITTTTANTGVRQDFNFVSGTTYTVSVYVKSISGATGFTADLQNAQTSPTLTLTSSWQRFTWTVTASASRTWLDFQLDGVGSFAIWGAQLNTGSVALPYVATTSSIYLPPAYNSTTPKNLLGFTQEPENAAWTKSNSYVQQNLLTWSQDFDNAAWVPVAASVAANVTTAPDGTTTADKLTEDATTAVHSIFQAYSTVNGTTYTMSFYAKAAERTWVKTRGDIGINYFNLASGTVGTTASGVTATITAVGNGWYRCVATKTSAITGANNSQIAPTTADNVDSYAGTAGSGIFLWGAQLVQGSTAGDYTQTTSAAAPTRYLNWDGTLTGRKLVETTAAGFHQAAQSISPTGIPITYTLYAKAAERTQVAIQLGADASFFDLSAGTVVSGTNSTITAAGGGWWRCSITKSPASANVLVFTATGGSANYTGDGTSGIYVSDFQLSNSASVDPYVYNPQAAAASAAYYGPRFDYNPVTLAAKGLLIEEQRTNLLTYSNDVNGAAWGVFNAGTGSVLTRTTAYALSPDGTINANRLQMNKGAGTTTGDYTVIGNTISVTSGVTYIVSFWVKSTDGSSSYTIAVRPTWAASANLTASVTGTWTRVTVSGAATSTTSAQVQIGLFGGFTPSNSDIADILIYGVQVEAGSFATSYIPTVASQVTRNADSASMLGDNFYTWYNPNQGTLSAESTLASTGGNQRAICSCDLGATNNESFRISFASSNITNIGEIRSGGSLVASILVGSFTAGQVAKTAFGAAPNNANMASNGAIGTLDTSLTMPTPDRLNLGYSTQSAVYLNGHIRRIGYYNTRLPDSTLQALTTT